ncbi:MAG: hypothetical protein AAGA93_25175 [Actinomycetota bacterium]
MRRSWLDLSTEEAAAVLDRYLAEHDGYVARFVDERSSSTGRDRSSLDLSFASLRPAWTWHLADLRVPRRRLGRGGPPSPETWVADGPYWAPFHVPLVEPLGPTACWQINDLAAYLLETVRRNRADVDWAIDDDEDGGDVNQPVLQIAGQTILRATQVLVLTRRAVGLTGPKPGPDPVDGLARLVAHLDEGVASGDDPGPIDPAVEVVADGDEVVATFSDAVAAERSADVDALVGHLAERPGISSAQRTDREIVVVRTALDPESVERMITRYLGR